jgi:hypothetical protein
LSWSPQQHQPLTLHMKSQHPGSSISRQLQQPKHIIALVGNQQTNQISHINQNGCYHQQHQGQKARRKHAVQQNLHLRRTSLAETGRILTRHRHLPNLRPDGDGFRQALRSCSQEERPGQRGAPAPQPPGVCQYGHGCWGCGVE